MCVLAAATFLFGCTLAHAQRPMPHLAFVYPAGGQQGTTVTVAVGGQNLAGASVAYISGGAIAGKVVGYERPLTQRELNDLREKAQQLQDKRTAARADTTKPPFTAEDEKLAAEIRQQIATRGNRQAPPALAETVTLEITLAADAAPGERELRLKTSAGLSNPIVFCVGQLPEVGEAVVTATSTRTTRKNVLDARSGRPVTLRELTLPTVVNGQIMPGEVDGFRFNARKGQRLAVVASARALLPYLADAVPGWFQATLALYDATGRELAYEDDFRFNPDPVLLCEIPVDGVYTVEVKDAIYRGREDFVYRLAVGELPFVTSVFPLGASTTGPATFDVAGWNLASDHLELETKDKRPGTFLLSVRNQNLLSNPVRFALDTMPECLASEPNDSPENATLIVPPMMINGRIERAGDADLFRFQGTAGSEIVAEVVARRLGSPLDSLLTLLDAAGRQLALNDDHDDKGSGMLTHHADSRISLKLPADGTYTVRLADAQHHGGADYGYRLRISAPRPDFELRVTPATINVRAGATIPLTVYALRRDGFAGDITLGLRDAPRGFVLGGARIPGNADHVQLTLTAPSTPRDEPYDLTVVGIATIGTKTFAHAAVPAEDLMQAFAYRHLVPAKELKVCVTGRGTTPRVVAPSSLQLPVGGTARLRVSTSAARSAGRVVLELVDPPDGIAVQQCSTSGDVVEVVLSAQAAKAKLGLRGNLLFNAYTERPAPGAKTGADARPQRQLLGVVPAVPFEIVATSEPVG